VIAARLRNAAAEIAHWSEYDYVLVNDDLDRAFAELRSILAAERLKRARPGMASLAEKLAADLGAPTPVA
jgi:guanylate kinase